MGKNSLAFLRSKDHVGRYLVVVYSGVAVYRVLHVDMYENLFFVICNQNVCAYTSERERERSVQYPVLY